MNTLLKAMKEENAHSLTENRGKTYNQVVSNKLANLQNLFALGAAYRTRSDADVVNLFMKAFREDETYAMKCLFYLRDVRGGQGERRFFRTVLRYLATHEVEAARRNLENVSEYGRWDDLYCFVGTPLEDAAFQIMYKQLALDVQCKTPSLLAKWLKSENTSSAESRRLGAITRKHFRMTSKQYRRTLSILRARINVLERLMSENRWDEIEFDKIPSRAGFIYRNAFARRDIIKAKYEKFAKSTETNVNAGTLNPCDVVNKARQVRGGLEDTERLMVNKYYENLHDYFNNAIFDGVAVVDTSGSMTGWGDTIAPIDVAISLGMYCAEKCGKDSPWAGHYITFSRNARLVPVEGADFCDKVQRIMRANLCENTNIRSVFDLLLRLALENHVTQDAMPQNIVVISDMEFDSCASFRNTYNRWDVDRGNGYESEMEAIARIWAEHGYQMPHLIFWCVQSRQDNIPMRDNGNVTFVSGYSASLFEQVMTGKRGIDLVLNKLDSDRYAAIH